MTPKKRRHRKRQAPRSPMYPRVALTPDDGGWVAAAASFANETPKSYIERTLLPIAQEIVDTRAPLAKPFVPSPPASPPRSFSVNPADFKILLKAAAIEGLTMKRFAEKHLVPVARKEVIARVKAAIAGTGEIQQKAA